MAEHPDDVSVIKQILEGDPDAFALLLERYQGHVAKLVAAHVPGRDVAETAHEVFVRAYKSLSGYQPVKPFANWLTTITMRCCMDYWRRQYRSREAPISDLSENGQVWLDTAMADESVNQYEKLARQQEAREILNLVLDRLPPLDRMVLTLCYLEDRSTQETAEMLGISVANVKVRAFRARCKLKTFLQRYGIQGGGHEA